MIHQRPKYCLGIIVAVFSLLDIIFGMTALGIFMYVTIGLKEFVEFQVDADVSSGGIYVRAIQVLNSVFLVSLNCLQVIFAGILFANLMQRNPDLVDTLKKSYNWLQVTKPLYMLLCVKIILIVMYSFIPPPPSASGKQLTVFLETRKEFTNTTRLKLNFACNIIAIIEWAWKPIAIYYIQRFVLDLHKHLDLRLPVYVKVNYPCQKSDIRAKDLNKRFSTDSTTTTTTKPNDDINYCNAISTSATISWKDCSFRSPRDSCSTPWSMKKKSTFQEPCILQSIYMISSSTTLGNHNNYYNHAPATTKTTNTAFAATISSSSSIVSVTTPEHIHL